MPVRALFVFILSVVSFFGFVSQAHADYFVWQDPDTGLSMSYPDTWRRGNNQNPNDIMTILAPSGEEDARCVVRASDDQRFLIYPPRYSAAVQKVAYSKAYWDAFVKIYDNPHIHAVFDQAGLGRGVASYATASYDTVWPEPYARRTSVMSVSLYNGTAYLLDCSTGEKSFAKWRPLFMSIMASIDFKKSHHELVTGDYRYFLDGYNLKFTDEKKHFTTKF